MQAEEDYEALGLKSKEGDADAIEEWLSSLERDPNSQALLLSPGDRNKSRRFSVPPARRHGPDACVWPDSYSRV